MYSIPVHMLLSIGSVVVSFGSSGFKTGSAKSPPEFGETGIFETGATESEYTQLLVYESPALSAFSVGALGGFKSLDASSHVPSQRGCFSRHRLIL